VSNEAGRCSSRARFVARLVRQPVASGSRFPRPSSGTGPAGHCADRRHGASTTRTRSSLARHSSTSRALVVIHWPKQWLAGRFESAFVCAPTDGGAAPRPADRASPSWAARSPENGFLPAASESSPRPADHVSASSGWATRLPMSRHHVSRLTCGQRAESRGGRVVVLCADCAKPTD
jgi:hypothetical protein